MDEFTGRFNGLVGRCTERFTSCASLKAKEERVVEPSAAIIERMQDLMDSNGVDSSKL